MLFAVTVVAIVSAATLPQLFVGLDRARTIAAARYLAQQCGVARFQAVGQGRYVALQFTPAGTDYLAQAFGDGNHNGVQSRDIANGVDPPLAPPDSLAAKFPGVRVALDPTLGLGSDPIRVSGSSLLSFSPFGTASAGSIYVLGRDGTQMAIRILSATGRTRIQRYERSTATWEQP